MRHLDTLSQKIFSLSMRVAPYFFAFLVLISIYHVIFAKRIIPGVRIARVNIGGLTYRQAVDKLKNKEGLTQKTLTLKSGESSYELRSEDIDLAYNWDAAITRAFEVGRTGNVYVDTKDKLAGFVKPLHIGGFYDYDEQKLSTFFATLVGDINSPAKSAHFELSGTELKVTAEQPGKKVDDKAIYAMIVDSFENMEFGERAITIEDDSPKILATELEPYLPTAKKIVFNPISVKYEKNVWKLSNEQKLEFLQYNKADEKLDLNKAAFKSFLESISPIVNELPRGVVSQAVDNKVISVELLKDGVQLDVDKSLEDFKVSFFDLKPDSQIAINKISGPIDPKSYGILGLLGEGVSKFTGSAPGRIKNLTLAAERANGVLVPPGATFSMNDSIGEISAATGYDAAWIIMGNRTVLGHGGGVCQSSTTLFRAVLNSGLPVVERNPHAYRVSYYEIENPIGQDASIFQPTLDLKFKNDTPNYVLVQSQIFPDEKKLIFRLYGTPDGRSVQISEPVISSSSPAPAPLYQEDASLPKGTTKQIDFAASGATVSFTRKVTKGEDVIYDDIFRTNYQPWRAVFLVGTKE